MKLTKVALRIWIGIASTFGFLMGWMFLAHSGKPVADVAAAQASQDTRSNSVAVAPLPTLPPVPSLDDMTKGTQVQAPQPIQLPALPRVSSGSPRIRTGGS
jgi:hypothetical protein